MESYNNISIKRSLARNLSGFPVLPTVLKKEANISVHDRELCEMRKNYEERLKVAYETIEALQIDLNDTIKKTKVSSLLKFHPRIQRLLCGKTI